MSVGREVFFSQRKKKIVVEPGIVHMQIRRKMCLCADFSFTGVGVNADDSIVCVCVCVSVCVFV